MSARCCALCGECGEVLYAGLRDRHFSAEGTWDLRLCRRCDLTWLDPFPAAEELGAFYADYYTHGSEAGGSLQGLARLIRLCLPAVTYGHPLPMSGRERVLATLLSWIGPLRDVAGPLVLWLRGSQRGRLLDVGCGNGDFLVRMRELGWQVNGLEPDSEAVRVACELHGLDVSCGLPAPETLPTESFDVVTANHVLEHTLDPAQFLRELHRTLKPGGTLVITTPNMMGLGRRRFGPHWLHWDPPRHLWGFGPRALRALVANAGFTETRVLTSANLARMTYRASSAMARQGTLPGLQIPPAGGLGLVRSVGFWLWEYLLSRFAPWGENLGVMATKPARGNERAR